MAKKKNYTVNGAEYFRIRRKIGEDANGKAIMKAFYGSGKTEAEEKYRLFMEELSKGNLAGKNDSLGKVAKFYTYNVLINESLAPGTKEMYEREYRIKLAPSNLAIRPVKEIRGSDIQEFLNLLAMGQLDGKMIKVSQASLRSLVKFLKRLYIYLEKEGYCQNIMGSVIVPQIEKNAEPEAHDISVFTDDEIKKIIETPNRKHFLFVLALSTGLRAGELMALKYDDFSEGKLRVNKQLNSHYEINADGSREFVNVIQKPKSASSVRTVPLPENVWNEFQHHKIEHQREMFREGYRTDYVFTTDTGKLLHKGNIRVAWMRHLKKAKVPYKKFHCCRSTCCTILCKQGVPLETASKIMGHSDINVTAEFYRFVGKNEMQEAADRINSLFAIEN